MITDKFEEQVFFTTARITSPTNLGLGSSVGTGFLIQAPLNDEEKRNVILLISNKHVFVNPKGNINFNFNRKTADGKPDFGNVQSFTAADFASIYTEHPDQNVDLACINASNISQPEYNIYHRALTPDLISEFDEDLLIPGLDVWFIGYPENRFDTVNNLPLLRRGYISSLPKIDFNNKKQFVIDAQVFQGSSGSPVFAPIKGKFRLIGVVTETMIKHGKLQAIPAFQAALGVQQILGLGLVIKATQIKELVNLAVDKVKEALKKNDEPINE
ncbi:MAG: trypsin-like peptidase domain-containing protein [Bacteroidetes bacterium]|nr:trypsin-like peptidase domain-containing protein [Bacteroidota bacterium]